LAAPKDRPNLGPFAVLGVFLFIWTLIPSSWKAVTKTKFDEFHAPLWEITSRLDDLSDYWGHLSDSKKTLIAKNRDLARIRADFDVQSERKLTLENELAKINGLKAYINSLELQLGLDQARSYSPIIARVSHRSLSAWWQSLAIRKGTTDGLYQGLGGVFSDGIAGRLIQVSSNFAKLELACNSNFRIVGNFRGDDRPVTFQGGGILAGGKPWGMVIDVPHDLSASQEYPLTLVTSELGGTFPSGLPIGKVIELEESGDGLFKTGLVKLSHNLSKLSEVTILVPDSQN
jgi:rod shape-determining protein MreC